MSIGGPLRAAVVALGCALVLTACGGASSSGGSSSRQGGSSTASAGPAANGGVLQAGEATDPDHLDPALSYTNEGWEMLEATNDGLVRFAPAAGGAGNVVVPDLATALPTVSDHGRTYTFQVRAGVMFSAPVSRPVRPSDIKYSIERMFRMNSPGVGFYGDIAGAARFAKTRKGAISGIVADDATHTLTIRLTQPDGTFLEYMAMPFADAVPAGTPIKDISTDSRWRIATGPYRISQYVPKDHITITRNPSFHQWSPSTPNGHLDGIQVTLGVSPEQSVNQIADGQLQFYFEQVPPDRLAELQARYPGQLHNYTRTNVTYFALNMRKPPMNDLRVREAINYATNRAALVKIFGGQGTPTENIVPPAMGPAFVAHHFYPYDLAKAKQLVAESGTKGMSVQVWASDTDPQPAAAQYMASVLQTLGYTATVKTLNEGIYYDTVSAQATDPQVSYNDWNQDFPEADDFIEGMADGNEITNVGNNDTANVNVAAINRRIEANKKLALGPARDATWASLDADIMRQAPYVPFLNRTFPKFEAANLHGQVFNNTFYELFPSMWIAK
jgi:peptide/nickel transport system substrate-binding protein